MAEILRWKEIKSRYPDRWVAVAHFSTDPDQPTYVKGEVYAVAEDKKQLAELIREKGENISLAIKFTGPRLVENWHGGLWPHPTE